MVHRASCIVGSLAAALVLAAGCGSSTAPPTPPGIQPEIVNVTDSFEYPITSIRTYTGSASYSWPNTGTVAAVDHSTVSDTGVGTVTVLDAAGQTVYSDTLATSGSYVSSAGTPGTWTVTVTYTSFSGTVNFRVQKG